MNTSRRGSVASGAVAPAVQPKALMVAFHFPPQSGSSGVMRTLNFVRHLPVNGWGTHVLSAHPMAYVERSAALMNLVPEGTPVSRAFAVDAARHLAWRGKYFGLLAIPDRWISWFFAATVRGWRIARAPDVQVIWSTYPIATAHLVALVVSRFSKKAWIADFRDPMHANSNELKGLQARVVAWIERKTLARATACVFTSRRALEQHERLYPGAAGRCRVIENGYDEHAFEGLVPARPGVADDRLFMLHSGLIYPADRDPTHFFIAVATLIEQGKLDRERVHIRFRAPQHGVEVLARARACGLEDLVEVAPAVPYREALAEMMGADLLLAFQGSKFNAQIPAKIYEYLRAKGHLLAVVDPQGDTAAVLEQFKGVDIADIDSADDIRRTLEAWLGVHRSPEMAALQSHNRNQVSVFSREAQAAQLADLLNHVSGRGPAGLSA